MLCLCFGKLAVTNFISYKPELSCMYYTNLSHFSILGPLESPPSGCVFFVFLGRRGVADTRSPLKESSTCCERSPDKEVTRVAGKNESKSGKKLAKQLEFSNTHCRGDQSSSPASM